MKDPYNKVHKMATSLYNKGLGQAQGRCLSGAIDSLTACTHLQKDHIDARNLLGLIYWEVGEVGQAIRHWAISLSTQEKDNLAKEYLETVQKDPAALARYSDTMGLFNKSLQYMSQGSEDIAIISLRKVISQNPNYVKAKALLSLYYITEKQNDKAAELLREILKTDKDNPQANYYWNMIKAQTKKPPMPESRIVKQKPARVKATGPKVASTIIQPKSLKGTIMAFVVGAICMLGVSTFLINPAQSADYKDQIRLAKEKEAGVYKELEDYKNKNQDEIRLLQEKKEELEQENEALKEEQMAQRQVLNLQSARQLSLDRQWSGSAEKLRGMSPEYLNETDHAAYSQLIEAVYPKAGEEFYNAGYKEYRANNYPKAIELLEKSYLYAKEEWFSSSALLTMGLVYEAQEEMEKANIYYQSVVDDYPGTKNATSAKRKLK